jgi:hypothetical protein
MGAGAVPTTVSAVPPPRQLSYKDALVSSVSRLVARLAGGSAGGGWETVQSRRGRRLARCPPRPEPRPVPVDPAGQMFQLLLC